MYYSFSYTISLIPYSIFLNIYCQTLGLVLRLRVDFVLPLSQEQEEQDEEQALTKIYQKGVY